MRSKKGCIIAATKFGGNLCLLKNRDRSYKPDIVILHTKIGGTEVCVMWDKVTQFCEGMNEHGIGIVNATLQGIEDEEEGQTKKKKVKRTLDGKRILKALSFDNLDDVVKSLETYEGGLLGHNFIGDGDQLYSLEITKDGEKYSSLLDPKRVNVRTNHGVHYPDAGYQEGDKYVSSIVRRWEAQKRIRELDSKKDLAKSLVKPIHDDDSIFNMVKRTEDMNTTSQMVMDLNKKEVWLYLFPSRVKFSGEYFKMKGDPKIKVKVFKYPGR